MDLKELYKTTLLAAADFDAKDIQSKGNREEFLRHIHVITDKIYYENMHDLQFFLDEKIFFLRESGKWWNFYSINKFELAAYDLALDICNSFLIRFVDGGGSNRSALIKK